jgi:hypothetical protein
MDVAAVREIARRPSLIKGVYDTCDLLCFFCPVTDRCLLFQTHPEILTVGHARIGVGTTEGLRALQDLAAVEGRAAPVEIEAFLSADRRKRAFLFELNDTLERLGGSYMNLAEAYLQSRADYPLQITAGQQGLPPLGVLAWFHDLMPARIFRAILSSRAADAGFGDRRQDALAAAKLALVGIDHSIAAVAVIASEDEDPRLPLLLTQLHLLRERLTARFPEVHVFKRPGLDG